MRGWGYKLIGKLQPQLFSFLDFLCISTVTLKPFAQAPLNYYYEWTSTMYSQRTPINIIFDASVLFKKWNDGMILYLIYIIYPSYFCFCQCFTSTWFWIDLGEILFMIVYYFNLNMHWKLRYWRGMGTLTGRLCLFCFLRLAFVAIFF